jgi:hypothetical protein
MNGINASYISRPIFFPRCSHTWERAPASEHRADLLSFLSGRSVGLLGRVISSSQGLYLFTNTKHPCPEWDSNPRSRFPSERRENTLPLGYRDRLTAN